MYIEHSGYLQCEKIIEENNSIPENKRLKLQLEFKKQGWQKKLWGVVEGTIPVREGSNKNWVIHGKWFERMFAYNEETRKELLIWEASKLPPKSEMMYHFTQFGLNLNYLPDDLKPILPRSDSRMRPDQRALENGDLELATLEKQRLEEFQRESRKKRQEAGIEY